MLKMMGKKISINFCQKFLLLFKPVDKVESVSVITLCIKLLIISALKIW